MVTLTFCPLESSTSSTTSSVGICCVSWREKQDWHPSPSPLRAPEPPSSAPHLLGLAQEAVEGLAASQRRVLPHCREGTRSQECHGKGQGPTAVPALLQPLSLPSGCMPGQPGTPPAHPHSARAGVWTGAEFRRMSPSNASATQGVVRCTRVEWSGAGRKPRATARLGQAHLTSLHVLLQLLPSLLYLCWGEREDLFWGKGWDHVGSILLP